MDKLQEIKQLIHQSQNINDYKSFFLYNNIDLKDINTDTFDLLTYLIEEKCSNDFIEFTSQQYPTLDYETANGTIPLFFAIHNEYFSLAELLLSHGATINFTDKNGKNVLLSLYHDHHRLSNRQLYFILEHGININALDSCGRSFLNYVVDDQNIPLLQKIVRFYEFDNDIILELITNHYRGKRCCSLELLRTIIETERQKLTLTDTMFYSALHHKNLELLEWLYRYGSQTVLEKINHHANILYKACSYANIPEIVRFLVEQGADVNEMMKDTHYTPLMMTAQEGHVEYAKILLEHHADVNAPNIKGFTPLMFASQNNRIEVVKILVEHGAQVNALNARHCSALTYACQEGFLEIAKYLVEQGANVNEKDTQDFTILMNAVQSGNKELVEFLLNTRKVKFNEKNYNGWNALMMACFRGRLDIIQELLEKGEKMNEKDVNGFTALMIACINGHRNIVQFLVEQGIDVDDKNRSGFTALMVVSQNGRRDIAKILLDHGANINARDNLGNSALMYATIIKQRSVVDFLLKHGANINVKNQKGDSPIIIACNNGSKELIELLVQYGVDLNTTNDKNLTPLAITQRRGFYDISSYLISCGAHSPETQYYL